MQTGYPCPYCGFTDHPEDANYCGKCGKPIKYNFHMDGRDFIYLSDLSELSSRDWIGYLRRNVNTTFFTKRFQVVDTSEITLFKSAQDRLRQLQKVIYEAQEFINEERSKSGNIFGGKSKTEILNDLNKILS